MEKNINCKISTPQFKNQKEHHLKIQSGIFNAETFYFTSIDIFGHDVQFKSIEQFEKYRIDTKVNHSKFSKFRKALGL